MENQPSPTGDNGRDGRGRFVPGNKLGRGNPLARRVARLRSALLREVSAADLRAMVRKLINHGKQGDVASIREVLNRVLGPPLPIDVLSRLEDLESISREGETHES